MSNRESLRPNAVLRQVMEREKVGAADVAKSLGVSRQHVYYLLDGRARFTAAMAVRFERAFGLRAEELLQLQLAEDLDEARNAIDGETTAGGGPMAEETPEGRG
ncbi:MAG: HigA family addiction module antidote protein [Alphaproteobacteria bacterium]|nr:HigA family addiction module antidote protein [Alphaproteobacteria bacterium]